MIIYKGLIELHYNPATDVLVTTLPNMTKLSLLEVEKCFDVVIENLQNYDVKKLLLDASQSVVEVEDAEYQAMALNFGWALAKTRLQKLARVSSTDKAREERSEKVAEAARNQINLPIAYASFSNTRDAMDWLLNDIPR